MKANAEDVCFSEKLVEVSQIMPDGEERRFYVPYDKLVIGVGMLPRDSSAKSCGTSRGPGYEVIRPLWN